MTSREQPRREHPVGSSHAGHASDVTDLLLRNKAVQRDRQFCLDHGRILLRSAVGFDVVKNLDGSTGPVLHARAQTTAGRGERYGLPLALETQRF